MALVPLLPDHVLGERFTLVGCATGHLQGLVVLALRSRLRLWSLSMEKPIQELHASKNTTASPNGSFVNTGVQATNLDQAAVTSSLRTWSAQKYLPSGSNWYRTLNQR